MAARARACGPRPEMYKDRQAKAEALCVALLSVTKPWDKMVKQKDTAFLKVCQYCTGD